MDRNEFYVMINRKKKAMDFTARLKFVAKIGALIVALVTILALINTFDTTSLMLGLIGGVIFAFIVCFFLFQSLEPQEEVPCPHCKKIYFDLPTMICHMQRKHVTNGPQNYVITVKNWPNPVQLKKYTQNTYGGMKRW